MEEKEINELIDKKVAEAKLEVAEKRLNYFIIIAGAFLSIFGVLIPLLLSNSSNNRMDTAIEEMKTEINRTTERVDQQMRNAKEDFRSSIFDTKNEYSNIKLEQQALIKDTRQQVNSSLSEYENKFNQLTKEALRKPRLVCLYGGKNITGQTLKFDKRNDNVLLKIKNEGDAPAKKIKIILYLKSEFNIQPVYGFDRSPHSDDAEFDESYEYTQYSSTLDPEESVMLSLSIFGEKVNTTSSAMLKIYYEQPEPLKYLFNIKVDFK